MPNTKPQPDSGSALPWKNSLLTKEEGDNLQNPINFFAKIIRDSDTFSILFEEIQNRRDDGSMIQYFDRVQKKNKPLCAFMIVQDDRGTNWICPVELGNTGAQFVRPLDLETDKPEDAFLSTTSFGSLRMTDNDYISACSRGFENASRLLLGEEAIVLSPNHRPVAAFYIFPKNA